MTPTLKKMGRQDYVRSRPVLQRSNRGSALTSTEACRRFLVSNRSENGQKVDDW